MEEVKLTQRDRILGYIVDFGSITPYDAFADLGITKLATRISELRKEGYNIVGKKVFAKNRYGQNIWYCEYSLGEKDGEKRATEDDSKEVQSRTEDSGQSED